MQQRQVPTNHRFDFRRKRFVDKGSKKLTRSAIRTYTSHHKYVAHLILASPEDIQAVDGGGAGTDSSYKCDDICIRQRKHPEVATVDRLKYGTD